MPLVRYVALAALIVWTAALLCSMAGDFVGLVDVLAYVCGAVIVVALFVMKFVGPPPHGFVPRVSLVVLMIAIAGGGQALRRPSASHAVLLALSLVTVAWYARE